MVDVQRAGPWLRQAQCSALQVGVVRASEYLPLPVLVVQIAQFGPQNGGLDFIQATVEARRLTDVSLLPAVLTQRPNPLRKLRIIGDHHTSVAQRSEVLGWIETEGAKIAPGAHLFALKRGAVGLG